MRKVELTMNEQLKYTVIKKLVDEGGNKERAALTLGISKRHVNRLIKAYIERGKAAFIHGNRYHKPITTIPDSTRQQILDLYQNKYFDANFTHFTELLASQEGIVCSVSSVSSILEQHFILSPKATRAKKKRVKQTLKKMQSQATSQRQASMLQKSLVAIEDAHPRRPRAAYFGELIQMDASSFEWIPGHIWHLHVAIDDASGAIVGAWFDTQETLKGYYHVFHQILTTYGIPYKFLTDRRTVFTYQKKKSPSLDEDTYTQFAYACHQLGVQLESSSIPQAKGRVERLNGTLQSRLPIEFRLAGITTIEMANEFLNSYIKEFNRRFSLPIHHSKSVFEVQPSMEKINLILAVLDKRTVDFGHSIRFKKQYYRLLDEHGLVVHFRKGTKVMAIEAFDGQLFCCVNDQDIYALEAIPERESKSEEFDADYEKPKPKEKYIPSMHHPWRRSAYTKFVQSQKHHWNDSCQSST